MVGDEDERVLGVPMHAEAGRLECSGGAQEGHGGAIQYGYKAGAQTSSGCSKDGGKVGDPWMRDVEVLSAIDR